MPRPDAELLAIVKADAYGHSLAACAPAAVRAGARWLGVTSVEEGIAARALCPAARVLVMGGIFPGQGPAILAHALTPVVWEPSQISELETAARDAGSPPGSVSVHLEIDTGMSRQGASRFSSDSLLAALNRQSPLRVEAVMTHLYASDETDGVATTEQLAQLDLAIGEIRKSALDPEWLSVGASAALLNGEAQIICLPGFALGSEADVPPRHRPLRRDSPLCSAVLPGENPLASWQRAKRCTRFLPGRPAWRACATSPPALRSGTTAPLWPPSRCAWR